MHWQERLHYTSIDLGLERVASVWHRLQPSRLNCPIITVGGTNGKGSCVALCAAILQAAGYSTGVYTSPHLLRYNERVCINGTMVTDIALCSAFARVNHVRGYISLTYFEFGTLAALDLFANAALDVIILEVGLGGRLDAVNILDADVALVTTVDIDHTDWLGTDKGSIAKEKAGIFRPGRPAVIGDVAAPAALVTYANQIGAPVYQSGQEFYTQHKPNYWNWYGPKTCILNLPTPSLNSVRQLDNAAAVLMVLNCLNERLPVDKQAICAGLINPTLPGRWQVIPGDITWVLDVAHNVQAAIHLAQNLATRACSGKTHAIFACLSDKDSAGILNALYPQVDRWYLAQLTGPRASLVSDLATTLENIDVMALKQGYNSVAAALTAALDAACTGDQILVTGSFLTVASALAHPALAIKY